MNGLIDAHCHIHSADFPLPVEKVLQRATYAGIEGIICVGTSLEDSERAVEFAAEHENVWVTVGLHPHDADGAHADELKERLVRFAAETKVVGIGECGLDYYYSHSNHDKQKAIFRAHLEAASNCTLPVMLHIRGSKEEPGDAFRDVWRIFDDFPRLTGVVHSFSAGQAELDGVLSRSLLVGLNGIMTFAKQEQHEAVRSIPLKDVALETDAPYLTPHPFRGKVNEPAYLATTAEFLAELWGVSVSALAAQTTKNTRQLFKLT